MTTAPEIESKHFTQAVVQLGERRPVIADQPIFNAQGVKIVERGTAINGGLYERLMAHRLQAPIEQSLSTEDTVTGRSLRAGIEDVLARHPFYGRMATSVERVARLDVIEKLPLPAPLAFQLTLARELHPDQYGHSLRSAWAMMWMVGGAAHLRFDLGMAAVTGLLHDIAMLHLDPVLLDPRAQLTRDLRRQLYSHPIIGARLLERHHEYPKEVARAVLEHHECDNGSGYPRNLTGAQLSPLGRAMALTEMVTAMAGGSHPGGELRLSVLLRMNMHRFDRTLISRVMGLLRPEQDPGSHEIPLLDQPTQRLREIDVMIRRWPDAAALPGLTPERRDGLAIVADQLAQLRRSLAEAGLAPEQLDQLGDAATRCCRASCRCSRPRRPGSCARWRADTPDGYPLALQQWLDESEPLCATVLAAMAQGDNGDE